MVEERDRIVDWQAPADGSPAPTTPPTRAVVWVAGLVVVVLAANAVVGWVGRADERREEGRAAAVEALFDALNEGIREIYVTGGLQRVDRAGLSWGFLQHLGAEADAPPGPAVTRVTADCTPTGVHVVRCELGQEGGPFAGLDTRARGYFVVDESGVVRRSWIELLGDEQRLASFLRDLRALLAEQHPEVHEAVFDTDLPFLHRQAFRDTVANRSLLAETLTPPR